MSIDDRPQNEPWGTAPVNEHVISCYLPVNDEVPQVWTVLVEKAGAVVHREIIPLYHRPIFGPDVDDVTILNDRVEEMIKELGLE